MRSGNDVHRGSVVTRIFAKGEPSAKLKPKDGESQLVVRTVGSENEWINHEFLHLV